MNELELQPHSSPYLTVRHSLFRQIVVDDQSVFAVVSEVFAHGAA